MVAAAALRLLASFRAVAVLLDTFAAPLIELFLLL
jgi:hypothetical protein